MGSLKRRLAALGAAVILVFGPVPAFALDYDYQGQMEDYFAGEGFQELLDKLPQGAKDFLEELGLYEGWITEEQVHSIGDELSMTLYGKYLQCL